jgi:hypothetical protein
MVGVCVLVDHELQSLEAPQRHPIAPGAEHQEGLLVLEAQLVQYLPEVPVHIYEYFTTCESLV